MTSGVAINLKLDCWLSSPNSINADRNTINYPTRPPKSVTEGVVESMSERTAFSDGVRKSPFECNLSTIVSRIRLRLSNSNL
jgi:hypothetical protein